MCVVLDVEQQTTSPGRGSRQPATTVHRPTGTSRPSAAQRVYTLYSKKFEPAIDSSRPNFASTRLASELTEGRWTLHLRHSTAMLSIEH